MTITMDPAGRLVIPAKIRREAAIQPGTPLEVRSRDGIIEIEPRPIDVTLERRGRVLVARPTRQTPSLRTASVERARRDLPRRRAVSSGVTVVEPSR